jgi:nicotinamide mononucleotide transporter
MGIVSSLITVFLLLSTRLYSEALLNSYYVLAGFYGWVVWYKKRGEEFAVSEWELRKHLWWILLALLLTLVTGKLLVLYTDGNNPYLDAGITVFSLLATYLEARKILSAWIYWILLNALSSGLFYYRDLKIYAGLMVIYTLFSVSGYVIWRKTMHAKGSIC